MSASIISNNLYKFIQGIDEIYTEYAKKNPKATYQTFYAYLYNTSDIDNERDNLRQYIIEKIKTLKKTIQKVYDAEKNIRDNRLGSVNRIKGAFTFVYVVLTIVFVAICFYVGKVYKNDFKKAAKMILTFILLYLIVSTLFVLLIMYVNHQINSIKRSFLQIKTAITNYTDFMLANVPPITPPKKTKSKQKNKTQVSERPSWKDDYFPIMKNLHAEGEGYNNLKDLEVKSSNVKTLKAVNEALSPYYDMMLKTRQNFADASSKDGIMSILDATIVKELSSIDIFSLENTSHYENDVFIGKMEDGEHYKLLIRGFMQLMTYMYPIYKNVSYQQLIAFMNEEEQAKNPDSFPNFNASATIIESFENAPDEGFAQGSSQGIDVSLTSDTSNNNGTTNANSTTNVNNTTIPNNTTNNNNTNITNNTPDNATNTNSNTTNTKNIINTVNNTQTITSTVTEPTRIPNLTTKTKNRVNDTIQNDPVLLQIVQYYPLQIDNFIDEIETMRLYDQTDITKPRVEIVQNFISDTVLAFNTIDETQSDKYLKLMNNTPSPSETRILMANFSKLFNAYFENLYKVFIREELAELNPTSSQYFVFNPVYMKQTLNTYVKASDLHSNFDPEYTKMIINIIIDDIVSEQKKRFIASYFSYENDTNKSLKVHEINNRMVKLVQKVSPTLTPYEFKVSDYAKYIINKVAENTENISTSVSNAIETLLTNIDYEVGVQKKLVSKTLADASNEMRFVPIHEFVHNIDKYKFNTLFSALQPDSLHSLVKNFDTRKYYLFAGREFKVKMAKSLMTMLILISIVAYILYGVILIDSQTNNSDKAVFADENVNTNKNKTRLDALLAGDTIWGAVFAFGVPFAGCIMFFAIYNSYLVKARNNIDFNKEIMRENTEEIKSSVIELLNIFKDLDAKIPFEIGAKSISEIKEIDTDTKQKLYKIIKNILISYDKCNYIIGIDKFDLPFPYAEILADSIMSLIILGLIGFTIVKFAPLGRLVELKDLYEYKESAQTLVNDQSFISEILTKSACHKDEMDGVMYTVKAVATMAIIVFMFLYSIQIIQSTSEYEGGLYTSPLYENKNCAS